jgi:hypothetical protein
MIMLLRNVPTGLYVQASEAWTGNPTEALTFKSMGEAVRFVKREGLRRMELMFLSENLCRVTEVPLEELPWGASIPRAERLRAA